MASKRDSLITKGELKRLISHIEKWGDGNFSKNMDFYSTGDDISDPTYFIFLTDKYYLKFFPDFDDSSGIYNIVRVLKDGASFNKAYKHSGDSIGGRKCPCVAPQYFFDEDSVLVENHLFKVKNNPSGWSKKVAEDWNLTGEGDPFVSKDSPYLWLIFKDKENKIYDKFLINKNKFELFIDVFPNKVNLSEEAKKSLDNQI